jgi:membrane protease YdiL (CAAX protease family)
VPQWETFALVTGVVLTILLALARLSQSAVRDDAESHHRLDALEASRSGESSDARGSTAMGPQPADVSSVVSLSENGNESNASTSPREGTLDDLVLAEPLERFDRLDLDAELDRPENRTAPDRDVAAISTGTLLANVALTQGLFGAVLLAAAWYTDIPAWAFGVTVDPLSTGLPALGVGVALGVGLYVANEVGAASADAMGVEYDERLRSMLSPETTGGWVLLFGGVLPIIAGVEEFVFRGAVVGATSAGLGVSPWAMAVVSSLAFALGHGAQGRVGIVVTGGLGFVLAGAFVLTGSLLVVFVAHYMVNALEFGVHELLGVEWVSGAG